VIAAGVEGARAELAAALGEDAVSAGESDRRLHGEDLSWHEGRLPDLVVWAGSTADVAAVLRIAAEHRVPVVPFGAGSSVEGHVIPVRGGIALDLSRMDRVLDVDTSALTATVEAGVTRLALEREVGQHGLRFAVDPGADATLGGMAATNAAGTMTVRYGKMRANVLALEAVLASGRIIRTGTRAAKSSAGYDLTGLLVGSEGTLGVITEVTVRLHPIPEHAVMLRASFDGTDAATGGAVDAFSAGVGLCRLELLDDWTVEAVNRYAKAGLPSGSMLIAELEGGKDATEAELATLREVLIAAGGHDLVEERDNTRRRALWNVRHDVFFALKAMAPGRASFSTDTCVPVSALAAHVRAAREALTAHDLVGGLLGHAGDGNVHACLLVDPTQPEEMERVRQFVDTLVDDALSHGGTCTGEHGVGLGKMAALEREHSDITPLMAQIKSVFDPAGIMNPGKVIRQID
jgi:D-lactate dehydrogenase (cytochrome)